MVSPTVSAGVERVMSEDEIDKFGLTIASARNARAVEYGSLSHEPFGSDKEGVCSFTTIRQLLT